MWKLVRVDHERCGEIDCHTYLWAPNDISGIGFTADIERAQATYLHYMQELGYAAFSECPPEIVATASWGHRHKTYIDYGATKIDDLPGPSEQGTEEE